MNARLNGVRPTVSAVLVVAILCLHGAAALLANPYLVNNTMDGPDPGPANSLRAAVYSIEHDPGSGPYLIQFNTGVTGTITLTSGEFLISKNLTITGPGATNLTIFSASTRIFNAEGVTLVLSGLRLSGTAIGQNGADGTGFASPNGGQGQVPPPLDTDRGGGGAIYSAASTLIISNCIFEGCSARGGNGGAGVSGFVSLAGTGGSGANQVEGGAIYTTGGAVHLYNSAFRSNSVYGGNGGPGGTAGSGAQTPGGAGGCGGSASGGAIVIGYNGSGMDVINCTFARNLAQGGNGGNGGNGFVGGAGGPGGCAGSASGGAVDVTRGCGSGDCTGFMNCTLASNSAVPGAGGLGGTNTSTSAVAPPGASAVGGGGGWLGQAVPFQNTIIAANTSTFGDGTDVSGMVNSKGNNLIGISDDGSSGWSATDLSGTLAAPLNPLLGPFQNNGGPTPTMALLPCSPAMDAGADTGLPADQRGFQRPSGAHTDIGAYEFQGPAPPCLTVTAPCHGTVLQTPNLGSYPLNSVVTLTAIPAEGWTFAGWSGDAGGTANPLTVMLASGESIAADFAPLSQPCVCPSGGQVSWWPGGLNADDIVAANNGTLFGGAGFAPGEAGSAFSFNGIDGYVDFGSGVGNFGTSDFTAEFWMKSSSARIEYLLGKRPGCGHASFWDLRLDASGVLEAEVDQDAAGDNYLDVVGSRAVNDGAFHHVAMVREARSLTLYVDGAPDMTGTASGTAAISNSGSVTAGKTGCTGFNASLHYFTGLLDEISLYGRALSPAEIQTLYTAGAAGKCLAPLFVTAVLPSGNSTTVTWLAQRGLTYRLQFKTDLNAPTWTDVSGDVTASGSSASKTDSPSPGSPPRFYRVEMFR